LDKEEQLVDFIAFDAFTSFSRDGGDITGTSKKASS
jgi:hypothetical protein